MRKNLKGTMGKVCDKLLQLRSIVQEKVLRSVWQLIVINSHPHKRLFFHCLA